MGEAILLKKYGSSSSAAASFAAIVVTYLSGLECTCSNGSITYTAENVSGHYIFPVPSQGNWTISIPGVETTVEIDTEGQIELVNLFPAFALYNAGDDGSLWTPYTEKGMGGSSSVTWGTDNVDVKGGSHATSGGGYYAAISYTTPINFSHYNSLSVNISSISGRGSGYIAVTDSIMTDGVPAVIYASATLESGGTFLDVSELIGEKYIVVYSAGKSGENRHNYITNITIS